MTFIIGKILSGNIVMGYRVLDTDNKTVKNYEVHAVKKHFRQLKINNYKLKNDELQEKSGDDSNYPIISISNLSVIKDKIVILYKTINRTYIICNGSGDIREVTAKQIKGCNLDDIANINSFKEFSNNIKSQCDNKSMAVNKTSKSVSKVDSILIDKNSDTVGSKNLKEKIRCLLDKLGVSQNNKHIADFENNISLFRTIHKNLQNLKISISKPDIRYENSETADSNKDNTDKINEHYKLVIEDKDGMKIVTKLIPSSYSGDIKIPDGVTHIDKEVFSYCKFNHCKLPDSLVYIGEGAFSYSSIQELQLPKSVTVIPHYCFYKSGLQKINLDHVVSIGNNSFSETPLVEAVFKSGLTQVGVASFMNCKELSKFEHTEELKKIRHEAFAGCIKLDKFDFNGIHEIEENAFNGTSLKSVTVNAELTYVKSYTFKSSQLSEVVIMDGCYKLADHAFVSNIPITYTIPKSVSNIGVHLFKTNDTVRCFYNSIAESSAKLAKCNIEYIDSDRKLSKVALKAAMIGIDLAKTIENYIKEAYNKDDVDYEFELDPDLNLLNIELDQNQLDLIGIDSIITPDGYEEKPKFKVLLEHYAKCCPLDGIGLSSVISKIAKTITISHTTVYDDGVSRILQLSYLDDKYESISSKYILILTGNTVRYCCLNNRYTNVYCRSKYSKNLSKLIDALSPGDTIGYNCTIAGKHYDCIAAKAGIRNKNKEEISLNIYQALFNCSIAIKLDKNYLALILPANGKILKCASLGKAVWNNENDESYKAKYCVVEDIQDLKTNTIIEYRVNSPSRDDILFSQIRNYTNDDISNRISEYSRVGIAKTTSYFYFKDYIDENTVSKVEDLDLKGLGYLLAFPVLETKTEAWLDKYKKKTIVPAAKFDIMLKDGTQILQYKTVKRVAMRNKLLTGGDRTIYVFEVYYRGQRIYITSSMLDIDDLFEMGKSMIVDTKDKKDDKDVYVDKSKFVIVSDNDIIPIAEFFVNTHEADSDKQSISMSTWLVVYKHTGHYYVAYRFRQNTLAVLLIRVGNMDVVTDYIANATTRQSRGYTLLNEIGQSEAAKYLGKTYSYRYRKQSNDTLLNARALAIDGETKIEKYIETGCPSVICHMFGVLSNNDTEDGVQGIRIEKDDAEDSIQEAIYTNDMYSAEEQYELSDDDFDIDMDELSNY